MQSEDDFVLTIQTKSPADIIKTYQKYKNEARNLEAKDNRETIKDFEIDRLRLVHTYLDWMKTHCDKTIQTMNQQREAET
ncbi:unnamed protein product, partial [Rotaria sp. Silwood2]